MKTYTIKSRHHGGYIETAPSVTDVEAFKRAAERDGYTVISVEENEDIIQMTCPECGHDAIIFINSYTLKYNSVEYDGTSYKCYNCGCFYDRKRTDD